MDDIELGDMVKCSITGFSGRVTARCDYLHANTTYAVQSRVDKDGKFIEAQWFDGAQLILIPKTEN